MPPARHVPAHPLLVAARQHYGLTQAEVARYLGLTTEQVRSAELGRRRLSPAAARRLAPLLDHLPPPLSVGRPLPALPVGPVAPLSAAQAAQLRARLRRVRHVAQELADTLARTDRLAAAHHQQRRGLAALRAVLLPDPARDGPSPLPPDPSVDPAQAADWLTWLETAPARRPPPAAPLAAHHALRQRVLHEEAAGLAALLGG